VGKVESGRRGAVRAWEMRRRRRGEVVRVDEGKLGVCGGRAEAEVSEGEMEGGWVGGSGRGGSVVGEGRDRLARIGSDVRGWAEEGAGG
jgi:hypothetical protein